MSGLVIISVVVGLMTIFIIGRRWVAQHSPMPSHLGVRNGFLAKCPAAPNCVCTQAHPTDPSHYIDPILFDQDMAIARERLLDILRQFPRTTIKANQPNYIHAEIKSLVWGRIDDIEFYFDRDHQVIHGRSAARLGYRDRGANQKRMEKIRDTFWDRDKR